MTDISIANLPIRLGQFLKLANLAQDGLEAKLRIQQGEVVVNGILEKRRGRQLVEGDAVAIGGRTYRIRSPKPSL
ncbi:MAG: RNA-binding S4 domain-containing protein [Desulfobulbaceae bacterium]|nr:MAG: RNA-binding S4 domain-containing protein [Desulfobulbaceae bacterium]